MGIELVSDRGLSPSDTDSPADAKKLTSRYEHECNSSVHYKLDALYSVVRLGRRFEEPLPRLLPRVLRSMRPQHVRKFFRFRTWCPRGLLFLL